MIAELKCIFSPDLETQAATNLDIESCCVLVTALIGPSGAEGEEAFDFEVCTPKWLTDNLADDEFRSGRHMLIVKEVNLEAVKKWISGLCAQTQGQNWNEIATTLSRYGHWEFEDYQPKN